MWVLVQVYGGFFQAGKLRVVCNSVSQGQGFIAGASINLGG